MSNDSSHIGLVAMFSFMAGGIIGAGAALVMAPQSGQKTRKQIRRFSEDVADQARDYVDNARDYARDYSGKVRDAIR